MDNDANRKIEVREALTESLEKWGGEGDKFLNSTANEKKNSIGVGMPQALWLNEFGSQLWAAFDEIPYQVGSSVFGKSWRDVDVRVMLDDEKWGAMGFGHPDECHQNGKWVALCMAFSLLGKHMTGLPIDFQIQKTSHANELYKGGPKEGHARSSLGHIELRMAKSFKTNE